MCCVLKQWQVLSTEMEEYHMPTEEPSRAGRSCAHPLKHSQNPLCKSYQGSQNQVTLVLQGWKMFQESMDRVTLNSGGVTSAEAI